MVHLLVGQYGSGRHEMAKMLSTLEIPCLDIQDAVKSTKVVCSVILPSELRQVITDNPDTAFSITYIKAISEEKRLEKLEFIKTTDPDRWAELEKDMKAQEPFVQEIETKLCCQSPSYFDNNIYNFMDCFYVINNYKYGSFIHIVNDMMAHSILFVELRKFLRKFINESKAKNMCTLSVGNNGKIKTVNNETQKYIDVSLDVATLALTNPGSPNLPQIVTDYIRTIHSDRNGDD